MWPKLVHLSLLETNKRPDPDLVLEAAVKEALSGTDKSTRESYFLKAAAYALVRHQAGTRPMAALPVPLAANAETLAICTPNAQLVLSKLLSDPARNSLLVGYALRKIMAQNQVVSPPLLAPVLTWLAAKKQKKPNMSDLLSVLGERGRWLALQNPEWQHLFGEKSWSKIDDSTSAERRSLLTALRAKSPDLVFDHIRECWPTEGVSERKEWLKILSIQPQVAEIPFIQAIFEDLSQPEQLKKAVNRELRQIAADLLLSQPAAPLFQQTVAQLKPYLQRPQNVLNLPGKLKWALPAKHDSFFRPEIMVAQFDFEAVGGNPQLTEAEFWLSELTLRLHPIAWETLISPDWPAILAFWETADYSAKTWPLLQNGSQALARAQYRPGILAYLERYTLNSTNVTMLHVLTQEELAKWLLKTSEMPPMGLLRPILERENWKWSPELSRLLLRHLMREDNIYQNATTACELCLHFDLVVMNDLLQFVNRDTSNWQQHQMIKTLAVPLLGLLQLRQEVDTAISH